MASDPGAAARELASFLREAGDPERAAREKRYLKSELGHLGVTVPAIRRIAADFAAAHVDLTRADLLELVEPLWLEPIHEQRMAAVELLDLHGSLLEAEDIALIERLLRESTNGCRTMTSGSAVPRCWRCSSRSGGATVTSSGSRVTRKATLAEREFFVRKAVGWVLRETGKKRPDLVYEWLLPRAANASGVTVREAVKYLPEPERDEILQRYRSGTSRGPR